jgi:hypothetical protein
MKSGTLLHRYGQKLNSFNNFDEHPPISSVIEICSVVSEMIYVDEEVDNLSSCFHFYTLYIPIIYKAD